MSSYSEEKKKKRLQSCVYYVQRQIKMYVNNEVAEIFLEGICGNL